MEVDPDVGGLLEEEGRGAGAGVDAQELEVLERAVLGLDEEGAVGGPADAGEVLEGAELGPDDAAALAGDDAEADAGVGGAGEGVAMVLLGAVADGVLALVDDPVDGDVGLVDLGEGEVRAVHGPPEAVVAVHLLLGDVLGEAGGLAGAAGAAGHLARGAAGDRDDVELGVLDVGDVGAVARELRVERGRAAGPGIDEEAQLGVGLGLDVDLAGRGDEQDVALLGPRVAGDAELALALALALELLLVREVLLGDAAAGRRGEEALGLRVEVEAEELTDERPLGAAQVGERAPVGREGDRRGVGGAGQGIGGGLFERDGRFEGEGRHGLRERGDHAALLVARARGGAEERGEGELG